jgi:mannosyltransferase OCH1-like enzyme
LNLIIIIIIFCKIILRSIFLHLINAKIEDRKQPTVNDGLKMGSFNNKKVESFSRVIIVMNDSRQSKFAKYSLYLLLLCCLLFLFFRYFETPGFRLTSSRDFWRRNKLIVPQPLNESEGDLFPKLVHQIWKSNGLPPQQTIGWRASCKSMNPTYLFQFFDDDDLIDLTYKYYPSYGALLEALHGVCK